MKTKICSKCEIEKSVNDFYKCKNNPDGYNYWCKKCIDDNSKIWKENNTERAKERWDKWCNNNTEEIKLRHNKWLENNPEKVKEYRKNGLIRNNQWRKDNPGESKKRQREYYRKNKEKINDYHKIWWGKNKEKRKIYNKNYQKNYRRERLRINPNLRLNSNMSGAIYRSLKRNKNGRHWETLVDFTQQDLRKHLESQFKDGMTWNNYGKKGWEIDHKIPVSLFNITGIKSKGFRACWALGNLQPLWQKENLKKSNKLFM